MAESNRIIVFHAAASKNIETAAHSYIKPALAKFFDTLKIV
jgi:hypothetical protein